MTLLFDREEKHPLVFPDGSRDTATFNLAACIDHPNIHVGSWSYYNDAQCPDDLATTLAPYTFPGAPEHLHIGRFCQIATGARFITASANHPMLGASTYPFAIFDPERLPTFRASLPRGSDVVVGNDCWIGREAMLLPGCRLGHGVIVGARAVVGGEVADYTIVAGNPARTIKMRFAPTDIARLLELAWWNWPEDRIATAIPALEAGDIDTLCKLA